MRYFLPGNVSADYFQDEQYKYSNVIKLNKAQN